LKILITGGAGFIGTHLTAEFLNNRHLVTAIDDLSTGDRGNTANFDGDPNYNFYQANLAKPLISLDLEKMVEESDIVYHLASVVGVALVDKEPHRTIRDNMEMALKLFPLVEKYKKKLVFTSTSEVYGDLADSEVFKEDQTLQIKPPTNLRWGYAATKLTQEFLLHSYNFDFVVARLFNVVGPLQKSEFGMVLPRFIDWAKKGEDIKIYGDGKQTRCFCHIDYCSKILYEMGLFHECDGQIVNIGTNEEVTIEELAIKVKEITKSSSKIVKIPYADEFSNQHEDIIRRIPCTDKLIKLLGIAPKQSLEDIIKDML